MKHYNEVILEKTAIQPTYWAVKMLMLAHSSRPKPDQVYVKCTQPHLNIIRFC